MPGFSYQLIEDQTNRQAFKITLHESDRAFHKPAAGNVLTMILVTRGAGQVFRDEAAYDFSSNCLLCFSLYQVFKISAKETFEGIVINFHPSFFCLFKHRREVSCNGILFNNLYDTPVVNLNDEEVKTLRVIAGQMREEFEKHDTPDQDILLSYLKIFLIDASRTKQQQQTGEFKTNDRDNPLVLPLKNAIEENFKTLHSPGDYAHLLYVSTPVLNNIAKQYFKKTLTNLIAERVIIEAKRELYLSSKPIKEISSELGYEDEFYFSRFFKKHTGVSPLFFREKVGFNKLQEYGDSPGL